MISNLITDRTQADVSHLRAQREKILNEGWAALSEAEQMEYLAGLKGGYNATDLNRVTHAMEYLVERIRSFGYAVNYEKVKVPHTETGLDDYTWYHSDIPQTNELNAYLQNVGWLREAMVLYPNTPEVPADMEGFTFTEANDIEQILVNIETIINLMVASFIYSGELFSGEVI